MPAPLPNKIDTLSELILTTVRSCLPSPLKSPTVTELGKALTPKFAAAAKLTGVQVAGVVTVSVKVLVVMAPTLSKALTVTVYVPAGYASVTRTMPVAGSAASFPLKSVEVATLILVIPVGAVLGATVALPLSGNEVAG